MVSIHVPCLLLHVYYVNSSILPGKVCPSGMTCKRIAGQVSITSLQYLPGLFFLLVVNAHSLHNRKATSHNGNCITPSIRC